ncbi:MAG: Holliday junction branch migration protein RuvA [Porphyromonas sp.]|nr:Holliday junction branch migration protein RuvA [Porphyromonas sp.]
MIEYIRGQVVERTPAYAVVESGGIGFFLAISLNTYNLIQLNEEAKLYVHEVVNRDGNWDLYGFSESSERHLFRLLNTVSGIGPSAARLMLSTYTPEELSAHIANGDERALKAVKGIGTRSAQRIILELKEKITTEMGEYGSIGVAQKDQVLSIDKREQYEEVEKAFVALGYTATVAQKVVTELVKRDPNMSINEMIRQGLRLL